MLNILNELYCHLIAKPPEHKAANDQSLNTGIATDAAITFFCEGSSVYMDYIYVSEVVYSFYHIKVCSTPCSALFKKRGV